MSKRDYHYLLVGVLIILAGLAYEQSYYEVGAIVAGLIASFSEIKSHYDEAQS